MWIKKVDTVKRIKEAKLAPGQTNNVFTQAEHRLLINK
jgi:hypothetical protein